MSESIQTILASSLSQVFFILWFLIASLDLLSPRVIVLQLYPSQTVFIFSLKMIFLSDSYHMLLFLHREAFLQGLGGPPLEDFSPQIHKYQYIQLTIQYLPQYSSYFLWKRYLLKGWNCRWLSLLYDLFFWFRLKRWKMGLIFSVRRCADWQSSAIPFAGRHRTIR